MNSSLELATRDAIFLLREKLGQQLAFLLEANVEEALNDDETLSHVLRQVIPVYAKADAEGIRRYMHDWIEHGGRADRDVDLQVPLRMRRSWVRTPMEITHFSGIFKHSMASLVPQAPTTIAWPKNAIIQPGPC